MGSGGEADRGRGSGGGRVCEKYLEELEHNKEEADRIELKVENEELKEKLEEINQQLCVESNKRIKAEEEVAQNKTTIEKLTRTPEERASVGV